MKINREIKKPDTSGEKTIREWIGVLFREPLLLEKKQMTVEDFDYNCEKMIKAMENGSWKEKSGLYKECLRTFSKIVSLYNTLQEEHLTLDEPISWEDFCWIKDNFYKKHKLWNDFDFYITKG